MQTFLLHSQIAQSFHYVGRKFLGEDGGRDYAILLAEIYMYNNNKVHINPSESLR